MCEFLILIFLFFFLLTLILSIFHHSSQAFTCYFSSSLSFSFFLSQILFRSKFVFESNRWEGNVYFCKWVQFFHSLKKREAIFHCGFSFFPKIDCKLGKTICENEKISKSKKKCIFHLIWHWEWVNYFWNIL